MPSINYGRSSYERGEGDLPELPVVNMYAEQSDSEGVVLQSRRGLSAHSVNVGDSPIDAIFKRDGILGGDIFTVSGGSLYRNSTLIGAIAGDGFVSIVGNERGIFVNAGTLSYHYEGTALTQIAFPDNADVNRLVAGASRIMFVRAGTGAFYFTRPLATDVEGLNFATAESIPDQLLDALFIDDSLVLFGSESVEYWLNTGDDELPFQPLEGRVLEQGIKATGCATVWNNTFAFVGDDNVIYDPNMQILSNHGLEEQIAQSASCKLFSLQLDGHEMLALRIDSGTHIRSSRTGLWCELQSYGQENFIGCCYSSGLFGGAYSGDIYEFGDDYSDNGGILERRIRAGIPINGAALHVNNLRVRANAGQTPFLEGIYSNPVIEMRKSGDLGQTWTSWKQRTLGKQGQYRKNIEWRAQGIASRPGVLFEFRVTDPIPFRVSDVLINEQYGGR